METKAWCSLLCTSTNRNTLYRLRFNQVSSVLLGGVDYAYVQKTPKYLVLFPADEKTDPLKTNNRVHIVHKDERNINRPVVEVCLNRIVLHEGLLSSDYFGSKKRYKVKRDKHGNVYICLQEVAE